MYACPCGVLPSSNQLLVGSVSRDVCQNHCLNLFCAKDHLEIRPTNALTHVWYLLLSLVILTKLAKTGRLSLAPFVPASGTHWSGVGYALVFCVLSFAGFEAAATLGVFDELCTSKGRGPVTLLGMRRTLPLRTLARSLPGTRRRSSPGALPKRNRPVGERCANTRACDFRARWKPMRHTTTEKQSRSRRSVAAEPALVARTTLPTHPMRRPMARPSARSPIA